MKKRTLTSRVRATGCAITCAVMTCIAGPAFAQPAAREGKAPVAGPFFFIQISDPQFGFAEADAGVAQETANLEFAIATANRLHPAFLVVTGDLVNKAGDAVQMGEYRRVMARLDPKIPVYNVPGNHDVGNVPTPASLASYRAVFGPDHYAFRFGDFVGIVFNSSLFAAPQQAPEQAGEQERWLRQELEGAKKRGTRHVVLFSHHPLFIAEAGESDAYVNIPRPARARLLELLQAYGVRVVFAGHHHQNAIAWDKEIEVVTTGPIGKPLGEGRSGMRIVTVTGAGITHRYYELGELPARVVLAR